VTASPGFQDRPEIYSRGAWLVMRALDPLPWPWGEEILANLFAAKAFIRPSLLRKALAWAGHYPLAGPSRWRLALSCCAHHGRFVARQALLGIRTPEDLRRHVVLKGEAHLTAASTGAILLGFHMGPPGVAVALRAVGHPVTWMGGLRAFRTRWNEAWQPIREASDTLTLSRDSASPAGVLYRARRLLLDGGTLYVAAEGGAGREAFQVALPGGSARIRSGWFVLRRQCAVPVLPVLTHLEGRTQVITICPPLPPPDPDQARDLEVCRVKIAALFQDYVRRFPEQCYALTFRAGRLSRRRRAAPARGTTGGSGGACASRRP
jgi:lauroyl/myristoyl acyltransferase